MGRAVVGQQPALLAVHDDGFPASRQLRGCAVTSQAGFRHLSGASCSLWPRFTPQIAFLSKSPEYKSLSSTLRLPAVTHSLSRLGFFLSVQQKAASQGRCPRSAPFIAHSQPSSSWWGDLRGRFQTPHGPVGFRRGTGRHRHLPGTGLFTGVCPVQLFIQQG